MKWLINSLLALGSALLLAATLWAAVRQVGIDAHREMLEAEARRIYDAFDVFYERYGAFPNAYAVPRFELDTLEPLQRRGYYSDRLTGLLRDHRLDGYDSPDDRGLNQEFWIELTSRHDPALRYVVARSDDAPLGGGRWLDGVYAFRRGTLESL